MTIAGRRTEVHCCRVRLTNDVSVEREKVGYEPQASQRLERESAGEWHVAPAILSTRARFFGHAHVIRRPTVSGWHFFLYYVT